MKFTSIIFEYLYCVVAVAGGDGLSIGGYGHSNRGQH